MRFASTALALLATTSLGGLSLAACGDAGDDLAPADAGAPDAARDAGAPDAAPGVLLTNRTDPCTPQTIFALAGEEGHFAAARLTPPSYPFRIDAVRYFAATQDNQCTSTGAQKLLVFRGTSPVPPATPTIEATLDVPATPGPYPVGDRVIGVALETPLLLVAGEDLWVAVQMVGTAPSQTCVVVCAENGQDDRNYWSNATMAPYPWATMASFDLDESMLIEAVGQPVP